jgi:hypothetical protein
MFPLAKSIKILNVHNPKYTADEARAIRDMLITLAEIEYKLIK